MSDGWSVGASRALRHPKWALLGASRSTLQVTGGHCRRVKNPCDHWGFRGFSRERATGIEPAFSAWEADVLPLNYARVAEVNPLRPKHYYRLDWMAQSGSLIT